MAVSDDVSRKLTAMAREVSRVAPPAVNKAALEMTKTVRREIQRVSGDGRLSGVGRSGARVGARYDVKTAGMNASALIRATGPLHLVERDTKAHPIEPKARRQRAAARGGRKAAIRLANGRVVARVREHPGTTGQHPFEKGVAKSEPTAKKILRRASADAALRGFRA